MIAAGDVDLFEKYLTYPMIQLMMMGLRIAENDYVMKEEFKAERLKRKMEALKAKSKKQ